MSADTVSKLLTFSITLLGAYVAFAAFTPTIIQKYLDVLEKAPEGTYDQRVMDEFFNPTLQAIRTYVKAFPWLYVVTGTCTGLLLMNLAFSDVPCVGVTCQLLWLPRAVTGGLFLCLLYLAYVAYLFLQLFTKAMEKLTTPKSEG